ncbi:hypothetical protein DVH26_18890 [Paenibacillus sp. H1-7]|nr:hypothetical protein DVH26_18890 [Paenibacillus sp. H1-7]
MEHLYFQKSLDMVDDKHKQAGSAPNISPNHGKAKPLLYKSFDGYLAGNKDVNTALREGKKIVIKRCSNRKAHLGNLRSLRRFFYCRIRESD